MQNLLRDKKGLLIYEVDDSFSTLLHGSLFKIH